jgi:DNA-3-methyladenine glycosylase
MMDLGDLLLGEPELAAPLLLGCRLISHLGGDTVAVRLTEVEAYKGSDDPASHAFRGRTRRNGSMFERPGTLYVYRSYGIHSCANIAAGPAGTGWGILLRGGEVTEGTQVARRRRGRDLGLADGPGKLAQALGITLEHDGVDLLDERSPIRLHPGEGAELVVSTPRVGISKATDRHWRFVAATAVGPLR